MARPVFELRSAQSPDAPSGGVRVRLAALNDNSPPSTFLPRARGGRLSSSRETNAPVWFQSAPLAREATAGVPPLGGPGQDAPRARARGDDGNKAIGYFGHVSIRAPRSRAGRLSRTITRLKRTGFNPRPALARGATAALPTGSVANPYY